MKLDGWVDTKFDLTVSYIFSFIALQQLLFNDTFFFLSHFIDSYSGVKCVVNQKNPVAQWKN